MSIAEAGVSNKGAFEKIPFMSLHGLVCRLYET